MGSSQINSRGLPIRGLAYADALLHALGVFPHLLVRGLGHAHQFQNLIHPVSQLCAAQAIEFPEMVHHLAARVLLGKIGELGQVADLLADIPAVNRSSQDGNGPGRGLEKPQDQFDGGGLSRPVQAQQTEGLVFVNVENEGFKGLDDLGLEPESGLVSLGQSPNLDRAGLVRIKRVGFQFPTST